MRAGAAVCARPCFSTTLIFLGLFLSPVFADCDTTSFCLDKSPRQPPVSIPLVENRAKQHQLEARRCGCANCPLGGWPTMFLGSVPIHQTVVAQGTRATWCARTLYRSFCVAPIAACLRFELRRTGRSSCRISFCSGSDFGDNEPIT